jgi:cellulose synthase/poly-beta-1,6-N-acetylglucosamine synthase-like glycosyltransferase
VDPVTEPTTATASGSVLARARLGIYVALSLAYLGWRALFTINPAAPLYAWLFLLLEAYAVTCALSFYVVTLAPARASAPSARTSFRVDVLICTYNEPISMLRQTIRRALEMDGAHRTWLLDDGHRPEARALAEELGCGYLSREENVHYKAGNLNNALRHTDGDLVLILDADHLVRRHFLARVLGYFEDERVALVQTPQVFYNVDSFQHHLDVRSRALWHEGAIFHHVIQPGANRWNAALCVGTGAVLRRSALEQIGGFPTESITEDVLTSMRLHARGFRSVFHDEPLGFLLAPESLLQYLTQRLRWGQGSMQVLRTSNPLTLAGLSLPQRWVYLMALSSFAQALVHLAYYVAPALFLLGGPAPLSVARPIGFLPLFLHMAVDLGMFRWAMGPLGRPLLAECYKFLNVYCFLKSLTGLFRRGRLRFQVTNKGKDTGATLWLLSFQFSLLLLNVTAVGYGILRLINASTGLERLGLGVALFFAGLFCLVGTASAIFAFERMAAHADYAFPDHLEATAELAGSSLEVVVVRANESEVRFVIPDGAAVPHPGERVALGVSLEDTRPPVQLAGRTRTLEATEVGIAVQLELEPLSNDARDRLFDRLCEHAIPGMIDPLVSVWSGRRGQPRPAQTGSYYLPLQPKVL